MMNMAAMMGWGASPSSSSSLHENGQQLGGWRKGPWASEEDRLLSEYVSSHGEGRWSSVARSSGLNRSGKSCRLRWVNYLRPGLKRGQITPQEEGIIIELHALWGNKWSTIARYLPGRTDNEIKNYWRTHFKKKPAGNKTSGHHKQGKRKAAQAMLHEQMTHQQQQRQQPAVQDHPMVNADLHARPKEREPEASLEPNPAEDNKSWHGTVAHQDPTVPYWSSEFTGDQDVLWGGLWNLVDAGPAQPGRMDCNKMAMQNQASTIANGSGGGVVLPCASGDANGLCNNVGFGGGYYVIY